MSARPRSRAELRRSELHSSGRLRSALYGPVLVALIFAVSACGGTTARETPAQSVASNARGLQLVTSSEGWVLTDGALLWVASAGSARNITPAGASAMAIRGVFFADQEHGWAAAVAGRTADGTSLSIFRTTNNGSTWTRANLKVSPGAVDPSSVSFVDAEHGWILVGVESSSNFSVGELWRTSDGGRTWTELAAPSGGTIHFVTPTLGFLAGGPLGEKLFITRDGGSSWQAQTVAPPQPLAQGTPVYGVPSFSNGTNGVLPVTFSGAPASGVAFYATADGGATWTLAAVRLIPGALEQGASVPTDVVGSSSWVVVPPNGARVFATPDRGHSWRVIAPNGLPAGVSHIDFATLARGWSLISGGQCTPGSKDDCALTREARATVDGGQTWNLLRGAASG
jgi:hypothetical protein